MRSHPCMCGSACSVGTGASWRLRGIRLGKRRRLEVMPPSSMAEGLLLAVGSGGLRPTQAQRLAQQAAADGIPSVQDRAFASLGASGSAPQNVERDMHKWLQGLHGIDISLFWADIPLWDNDAVREIAVPFLLPHEWLCALEGAGELRRSMASEDPRALANFWDWMHQQPFGADHPAFQDAELDFSRCVPLVIHTDGAESYTNHELSCWSISSLAVHGGETMDAKFLVASIPSWRMPTKEVRELAMSRFLGVIAWSFQACLRGIFPSSGPFGMELDHGRQQPAGLPLPGNWRAAYIGWKGDRKARALEHRMRRTWQTTQCCEFCEAVIPFRNAVSANLTFADMRPSAPRTQQPPA